jgi:hypothetical protein
MFERSIDANRHYSWFPRELQTTLKARKAQLPIGSARQAYWLSAPVVRSA